MSDGITEARKGFASYKNNSSDFSSKAKPQMFLEIFLNESDFALIQRNIENLNQKPEYIQIGDFIFEYVDGGFKIDSTYYIKLKMDDRIFTCDFKENEDVVNKYILYNGFRFGTNVFYLKIISSMVVINSSKITDYKQGVEKTYLFRVKVDRHYVNNNIKCDQDGVIFVVTDDPSVIYSKIKVDDIISIEKISSGYNFK